jgi:uncharacterized protein (DUF433 family)
MTTNTLTEAEKMRRVPGIIFVDTPVGDRVARIAGTGLEVFEVIGHYRDTGKDWHRLKELFDWLTDEQLRAALTYAEMFPEDVYPILEEMDRFDIEDFYAKNPWANPASR